MTERPTLTVRSPDDVLALVPYVMGFVPEDSLVMLTSGDAGQPVHARTDLPPDPAQLDLVVEPLVGAAQRNAARRAMVVVYTTDAAVALLAYERLTEGLERVGVETSLGLRADGACWYDVCDADDPGTPYDVASHPLAARAVFDGRVTYRSRQALSDSLVGTDPDSTERVLALCETAGARFVPDDRGSPGRAERVRSTLVAEGLWARDRLRACSEHGTTLDDPDLARLLVGLVSAELRDVLWAEIDTSSARGQVDFWTDVVRRSPLDLAAPPAALLAFAAWMAGEGALAWCALDRCLAADPGYTMAELVARALQAAMPPGAWVPIDPAALTLFSA